MAAKRKGQTKKPKQDFSPSEKKEGKEDPAFDFAQSLLIWKFNHIDFEGPFGWERVEKKDLVDRIFPFFEHYQQAKWHEVELGEHNHSAPVENMKNGGKPRFEKLDIDYDTVFQLQFGKGPRIIGIRDRAHFYVLWWDPEHDVYPSTKGKHAQVPKR